MAVITYIPEDFQNGFRELSWLTDEKFTAIENALALIDMASSMRELISNVAKSARIDKDELREIFLSLEGLISFLEKEEDIEEVSTDVVAILDAADSNEKIDGAILKKRVYGLLKDRKIYYASKAEDLVTENQNFFLQCRVLTDIRPIFDLDVEQAPKAGIITHTLHIHYRDKGAPAHNDFYITLESSDIDTLCDALIRALKKEASLQKILEKSEMTNLTD